MTRHVLVCGPRGSGTSTVAWLVLGSALTTGVRGSYVDLTQIGFCVPAPGADPAQTRLRARNLAAVWAVHRSAGAELFVGCASIEDPAAVELWGAAAGDQPATVVRLDASAATLRERLHAKARREAVELPGDTVPRLSETDLLALAEASARTADALTRAGVGDVVVPTDGRTPHDVAADICAALGWPHPT